MRANRYTYLLLLLTGLCRGAQLSAQGICSSSALAPVFSQTFGTSPSPTTKTTVPSGFTTNYAFNGSSQLADGQYMVTPLVQNSGKADWALGGDHTGNANGNMFLVNAGTGGSVFFQQQVNNLCPGSTYSFSAWMVNVNTQSLTLPICTSSYVYPNVTFNIKNTSGVILQSYNTGNLPFTADRNSAPNWQQYGFQFSLPSGTTSLILEMVDSYGGQPQCGNDLAIDDIVFSACTPQATIAFTTSSTLCAGSSTEMDVSLVNSAFLAPAYQWQKSTDGGSTWSNIGTAGTTAIAFPLNNVTVTDGGKYRVLVGPDVSSLSSNTCVTASNALTLTVHGLPSANISANSPLCAGGILNLQANVSGGLSPYSYNWAGPSFTSSLSSPVITNLSATVQSGGYALTVTDANQCSASATVQLSVLSSATQAHAGSAQIICGAAATQLAGNAPLIGTGQWTQTAGPGPAVFADATQGNTLVTGLVPGVYEFTWTITNGACAGTSDIVTVTVLAPAVPGTLSSDASVCAGINSGVLVLMGSSGTIVQWESSTDGMNWTPIPNNQPNYMYNNLTATTSYRVLLQNGACVPVYSNTVTITVSQPVTPGTITGDAVVCGSSNQGMLTLTGGGTVTQWESSTDGGLSWNAIANTTASLSYSNLVASTLYRALSSGGVCPSVYSNNATITVNPASASGTLSGDATVCVAANAGSITVTGYTGNITGWEYTTNGGQSWSLIPSGSDTYDYNNLSATTEFRAIVQSGVCAAVRTNTVSVTVQQASVGGVLSSDAAVCATANSGTISLTGATGSVLNWESSTDGGQTWNTINSTGTSLTYNNLSTSTSYRVNVQNGACAASKSSPVNITVQQPTIGGTLSGDATICASANSGTISLTGMTGSVLNWESSTDGGQTWNTINSTANSFTYNNLSVSTSYRVNVQNGACAASTSNSVNITVQQPTIGGTLSGDATVCASANSGTISLAGSTGSILNWESSIDGGQTWNTINSTGTSLTYNNLSASTSYRANVQNGTCAASKSNPVNITVQQPTVGGTLSGDATVCAAANSGTISLTGMTGSVLNWESSTDGGQTWNTINSTANSFTYNNLSASTSYRVNVQNGACAASTSNSVNITVQQPTVGGTLSGDVTVCASANSGTISLTGMTGSVLNWESSTDGGQTWNTINSTGTSLTYNNLATSTSYRANVQNGACAASTSNSVNITVQQPTVGGTLSGDATVCASANSGTISLTGMTGSVLNWESSADGGQTWNTINSTANSFTYNNLSASTSYRANVQNGACAASKSNSVSITVQQPTVGGTLSGDATVCASANSGTISLAGSTGSILNWESSTDGGQTWNTINSTANSFTYNNLSASTSYRVNVQNGTCAASKSNSVNITVQQPTIGGTLSGDATVCASANSGTISLTGMTGSILNWESSTDGGQTWNTINSTANSFTYNNLSASTSYRVNVQNGACAASKSNPVNITVQQPTVGGTLSGDATVCASANSGSISLAGSTGSILNWESSIDGGQTWNTINSTANSFTYTNLATSTSYRVNVQNGACAASKSNSINITVQQPTVGGTLSGEATVCASANSGTISLAGATGSILNWQSSADGGQTWNTINSNSASIPYNNLTGSTSYRVIVQNGVCAAAPSSAATITVRAAPSPANAGPDISLCNASAVTLNATQPSTGAGTWRVISGPGNASLGASGTQAIVTNLQPGSYSFAFTVSSAGCPSSEDTMLVINHAPVANSIDSGSLPACRGQVLTIHANNISGASYQWQKSIDDVNWENAGNAISATAYTLTVDITSYIRRIATLGSCAVTSNHAKIIVNTPVTDNLVAGNQQLCAGSTAQPISGNIPSGGDGNFSFRWERSPDNGASWSGIAGATSQNLQLADTLRATTLVRRIVSSAGCSGPLANTSTPIVLTVVPVPSLTLQYKGGVYCDKSTPVEFAATSTHADTLHWNFGDGNTETTTAAKITHSFAAPGNFLPSVHASNAAGCRVHVTAADTIRVDALNIGFKLAAAYNCGQTSYEFADTSVSFSPIVERLWTIGQQPLGTDPTVKQMFRSAGDYETGLTLRNQNGCMRSLQAKFSVSIFNYPDVNIDAIGQTCLNNLLELKSVINSTDSVTNRLWNLGNGSNASDSVVKVQYYSEGKYIVKLMVATVNNCLDSAVKQINVYSLPQINVVNNQTVCKGDSVELKATGASYYIWKDDRDSVLCSNCLTAKVKPSANATYKVIGYSKYGCTNIGATSVSLVQPFKMNVRSVDSVCLGANKNLFASGAASYLWAPDASLHGSNSASPSVTPTQTTTYHVTGTDSYHCFTDTASVKVVVGTPTQISAGADTMILSGAPVQLHASSALQNIRSWQWKGNATFSCLNCPAPAATVIMDECLTCSATNVFGCTTTDTICITTFCPGSEVFVPNAFSPDGDGINDILFVQGRGIKTIKSFRVYSRWGELVFEKTNFQPGDKSAGWDGRVRGKAASPDVFVYICEAICEKGIPAIFKGNTAIIK